MNDVFLIMHFIGLAMGLGTSFGFMFLGMASAKMEATEGQKFRLNAFALSRMGHVGLALLIISGIYLIIPYWAKITEYPLLIVKLVLVLVLAALIGIISSNARKAKAGNTEMHMKIIEPLGKLSLLTALAIVVLAVLSFH